MNATRTSVFLSLSVVAACVYGCSGGSSNGNQGAGSGSGGSQDVGAGGAQGVGTGSQGAGANHAGGASSTGSGGASGAGGSTFQSATGFDTSSHQWPTPDGGFAGAGYALESNTQVVTGDELWTTMDMDGDGRPDLVVTSLSGQQLGSPGARKWHVYKNTGSGFAKKPIEWKTPDGGVPGSGYTAAEHSPLNGVDEQWATVDLDGDGKPDLVVTSQGDGQFGKTGGRYWKFYKNTGSGFAMTATQWSTPDGGFASSPGQGFALMAASDLLSNDDAWMTMDIDGDGKPDLVVTGNMYREFGTTGARVWHVYKNTGSGFASESTDWPTPDAASDYTGYEFVSQTYVYSDEEIWSTIDINGDHKPDLVVTSFAGNQFGTTGAHVWHVYLNTGSGFAKTATQWATPDGGHATGSFNYTGDETGWDGDESWRTMDIDGDGKADLVVESTSSQEYGTPGAFVWHVYKNTGSGFATTPLSWPTPDGGLTTQGFPYGSFDTRADGYQTWTITDLDGDKRPDLVVTSNSSNEFGSAGARFWNVYFGKP